MRRRNMVVSLLATLLIMTVAVPAYADETEEPIFILFADAENGVSVFWNITADNFCAWEASGFDGPAPVEELVTATFAVVDSGAVSARYDTRRPMELWRFDDDVPPFIGPCEDIENQTGPWATGSAFVQWKDNDVFGEALRNNIFGDRGDGIVHDGNGDAWSYSWTFRGRLRGGEFSVIIDESHLAML